MGGVYLWLAKQRHQFAEVVHQTGQLEPVVVGVALANALGRLVQMHDVGHVDLQKQMAVKSVTVPQPV